jgi:chromosomal replication initiation ATPase DnaA
MQQFKCEHCGRVKNIFIEQCNEIKKEVAKKHMVTVKDIEGPSRKEEIVFARDEAMYRTRKETGAGLKAIGRCFNRTHATVIHALKKNSALTA